MWPFLIGFALYIGVSLYLQAHIEEFNAVFDAVSPGYGMTLYVLLGMATVMIPFTSLIPIMPLAVILWGWPMTALLTTIAWALGGQVIFEVARYFGKARMLKYLPPTQLQNIEQLIHDKGIVHSILVRMVVHGDIVSYAFALFTRVNRWEFLLITTVGVAPSAILYAFFGNLPIEYQFIMAAIVLFCLILYWIPDIGKPRRRAS